MPTQGDIRTRRQRAWTQPHSIRPNQTGAAVVIVSIPIAALVLFEQRRIVTGLTAGSFR